jgi:hypothetical protein
MTKPLSPLHRPLIPGEYDPVSTPPSPAPPSRIAVLASLDHRLLASRPHSLGPGGASALFSQAVFKALVDEMSEQLREGPFEITNEDGEVRRWAKEIIEAFEGE